MKASLLSQIHFMVTKLLWAVNIKDIRPAGSLHLIQRRVKPVLRHLEIMDTQIWQSNNSHRLMPYTSYKIVQFKKVDRKHSRNLHLNLLSTMIQAWKTRIKYNQKLKFQWWINLIIIPGFRVMILKKNIDFINLNTKSSPSLIRRKFHMFRRINLKSWMRATPHQRKCVLSLIKRGF